jgi:hypothetical protein
MGMITGDQILCHMIGDYVLQSDWAASEKTKRWVPAAVHALTYVVPFWVLVLFQGVPILNQLVALAVIGGTHYLIDRYRLSRHIGWVKNFLAPKWIETDKKVSKQSITIEKGTVLRWVDDVPVYARNYPWSECSSTGYHSSKPVWLSVWLMIITDNTLHVLINGLALMLLT